MFTFRDYIAFAERQLLLADEKERESLEANWLLIPATILAWSAIESFINNRLDDFALLPESVLQLHERAFLVEKRIRLVDGGSKVGQFILEGKEYNRIEDKIFFLIAKFGRYGRRRVKKGDVVWQHFEEFKNTRDALVHPHQNRQVTLSVKKVRQFIATSKEIIQLVSTSVWNKRLRF